MTARPTRRQRSCPCGYCTTLREAHRRLMARRNHPHYAARGNEQPLLEELIEADPPVGGLAFYVADLHRKSE